MTSKKVKKVNQRAGRGKKKKDKLKVMKRKRKNKKKERGNEGRIEKKKIPGH